MSEHIKLDERLDALLHPEAPVLTPEGRPSAGSSSTGIVEVAVDALRPGRYQPRGEVSEEGLAELADSIREQGIVQPLVVRAVEPAAGEPVYGGGPVYESEPLYEIVAGERRWRAARRAGLATVPVIVRELDDQSALAVALIENLQREDLNPIDQAQSLARLAKEFGLTHEQVAKAVGRSRATVSNLLRLLELEAEVKDLLARGSIDMGHARALLPLDPLRQVTMARKTERRGLSVRQVEKAVRNLLAAPPGPATAATTDLQTRWLQQQLTNEVGQRVAIRPSNDGGYTMSLAFGDLAQLSETLERIQELVERIRVTAGPRARDAG